MFDLVPAQETLPRGYLWLVVDLNPFSERDRIAQQVPAEGSIELILATLTEEDWKKVERGELSIFLNGVYVPREKWARVRPKPGTTLFVKVVPQDPISVIGLLGSVAGGATTTFLTGIGVSSILAGVAGAVVTFAITALGQALFGPSPGSINRGDESPTYAIAGARNQARRYAPVPVVLGRHRVVPLYGAVPYTEVAGNDQFLRFAVIWGYGPIALSDVKIGNTPIGNYEGVYIGNELTGAGSYTPRYPARASQENLSIRLDQNFVTRRTQIAGDEIGVTITFPQGLANIDDQGNVNTFSVAFVMEYRKVGDASWTPFSYSLDGTRGDGNFRRNLTSPIFGSQNVYVTERRNTRALEVNSQDLPPALGFDNTFFEVYGDTRQPVRFSVLVDNLPAGEYDIRVRRTSDEFGDPGGNPLWRADWTAIRAFDTSTDPIELEGLARTGYRIKATDQLNGLVDQLNGIVTSKLPTWNGSSWTGSNETSNPAAIFRYILTGAPNKRPVATANINDAELGEWYDFCVENDLAFNQVIDFRLPIRDLLQNVAAAGFARPTYTDDKWTVIIERPRSTIVQLFTPRNTFNFQARAVYKDPPEGLRVRFFNEEADYLEDERVVYDDGFNASNATKFEVVEFPGVTKPGQVYKIARHFLASARLRPEEFTFEIDVEHLVATRGDRCRLQHDVPLIGQTSFRIKAISGDAVTFDDFVVLTAGQVFSIRARKDDGTFATATGEADTSGTFQTLTIPGAGTSGIAVGDLVAFSGAGQDETLDVLIRDIEYLDDLRARVTCVPYSPAIYDAATSIPPYTTLITPPVSASFEGPPAPRIVSLVSDETALARTVTNEIIPQIIVIFDASADNSAQNAGRGRSRPPAFIQARFRLSGTQDRYTYTSQVSVDTREITLGPVESSRAYDVQIRAVDEFGGVSDWVSRENYTVIGTTTRPPAVSTFTLNVVGDQLFLEWTYPNIPLDVVGYEIRYSYLPNVTDWKNMSVLTTSLPGRLRSFTVPARPNGSLAIKPYDVNGLRSDDALYINATLAEDIPSTLITTSSTDDFSGATLTDVEIASDGADTWAQLGSSDVIADWATLSEVTTMTFSGGGTGVASEGFIEFGPQDLGAEYSFRIEADLDINGLVTFTSFMAGWDTLASIETISGDVTGDEGSVQIEIATAPDDTGGPNYGPWVPFVVGDYTARYYKFRIRLRTSNPLVSPKLTGATARNIMFDTVVRGEDLVSSDVVLPGASVTFSPAFYEIVSVAVTGQDLESGDYWEILNKNREGFDVTFYNSAGAPVSRTFDYQAVGYGRERGT